MINGYSGCKLLFKNGVVSKTSKDIDYNSRLEVQISKQMIFNNTSFIQAPKVLKKYYTQNLLSCDMEYCLGESAIEWIGTASREDLQAFTYIIISNIENCLSQSETVQLTCLQSTFENKISSLKGACENRIIRELYTSFPTDVSFPIGFCHGDLTLSNIIKGNSIYYIDFLDQFIESPLWDIVKLRQDTQYHWSAIIGNIEHYNSTLLSLNIMNEMIENHEIYQKWSKTLFFMEKLNLARIIPYVERGGFLYHFLNQKICQH
jgi:hypothetical protein